MGSNAETTDVTRVSPEELDKLRVEVARYDPKRGQAELTRGFPEEKYLWNKDFHPTPLSKRFWEWYTFAAVWFGMAFIVPTWTLASVGITMGLGTWDALLLVFLGNAIVLIPMVIQAHGGTRYGIAEPQLTRSRWGIYGAIFPSWIRAIIGAGWWGIESYILTEAVVGIYAVVANKLNVIQELVAKGMANPFTISTAFPAIFWTTFVLVIIFQILLLYFSPVPEAQPALRHFARIATILIIIGFVAVWYYFSSLANWQWSHIIVSPTASGSSYWITWLAFLNANIAYWATMALTMPDYTRFAKSQISHIVGQTLMPIQMAVASFFGIMTTGASITLYGIPFWDPVLLVTLHAPPALAIFANLVFALATFSVNVFANTIGPAYDFANTIPKYLSFFRGVLVVVAVAVALGAWTYYGSAYGYLFSWLLTYGGLLGGVEGIIIFDYALIRRFKFELPDIFWSRGRFRYWKGINPAAFIAWAITEFVIYAPWLPYHDVIFANSWLIAFAVSGIVYVPLMAYWVIPKWQPQLKGSIWKGYVADDVKNIFQGK